MGEVLNFYEILGLPFEASFEEIRGAYFAAARRMHPDINPDRSVHEEFLKIQKAYETLSNQDRRLAYNNSLNRETVASIYAYRFLTSRNQISPRQESQLIYGFLNFSSAGEIEVSRKLPRYISLVIDRSTSMKGDRMDTVKANVLQLFKKLNPQDVVSVVAFSDRAELLLPPTRAEHLQRSEYSILSINPSGGTEIFHGLDLGYKQLTTFANGSNNPHLILLTDGHTYGDEEKCYALARNAGDKGIVISGLGIGSEWNDEFLDKLASLSGGNSSYIKSSHELAEFLEKTIGVKHEIFANNIRIEFSMDANVKMNYAFRISPQTNEIVNQEILPLGVLCYGEELSLLCEFEVEHLPSGKDEIKIIDGWMYFNLPGEDTPRRVYLSKNVFVRPAKEDWQPPAEIVKALSKLNLYKMHEKIRDHVKTGNIDGATQYLKNLATNLLSIGNIDLAKVVIRESEHIQKYQQLSQDGDKRIKYGTRSLLLPSGQEK